MQSESQVRRRKKGNQWSNGTGKSNGYVQPSDHSPSSSILYWMIYFPIGILVGFYSWSFVYNYMKSLHENHLWFTNIKEIEREISLRTECGLYYSYYKRIVNAPTLRQGINELINDPITEHGHDINVLQRFNVHQEVALAVIYKLFNLASTGLQPIIFYTYTCFFLTGLHVFVLLLLCWYLSGSLGAGILTAVYFVCGLDDATRVFFSVNLREIFAFPFLWIQILFVCMYLARDQRSTACTGFLKLGIFVFGFLFCLMWQFNQFVFLIQVSALYGSAVLQLAPASKVQWVMFIDALSLLGVYLCQFCHPMILGSLVISLVPVSMVTLQLCKQWKMSGGIVIGFSKIIIQVVMTLLLTIVLNICVKSVITLDADEHIFKFLKGKFGLADPRDFEARIYLCHGAFQFLDIDFFYRNSRIFLFPLYFIVVAILIGLIGQRTILEWCATLIPLSKAAKQHVPQDANDLSDKAYFLNQRPQLAFLLIQSCLTGMVAMMTLRIKYLWFPHMAILACVGLSDVNMWTYLLDLVKMPGPKLAKFVREAAPLLLAAYLIYFQFLPVYNKQMGDLQEFYDPDTVDLMEWINKNTMKDASFGGSMQLLAGVTLCTGRHVTNHPHFEDRWLRDRTRQVYQIYARRKPEEVHKILKEMDAHYIILEDSICLARSDGCRTPDNVDLDNRHIPDNGMKPTQDLIKSNTPRFCVQVRNNEPNYTKYFKLVFENKTFRIFKVL